MCVSSCFESTLLALLRHHCFLITDLLCVLLFTFFTSSYFPPTFLSPPSVSWPMPISVQTISALVTHTTLTITHFVVWNIRNGEKWPEPEDPPSGLESDCKDLGVKLGEWEKFWVTGRRCEDVLHVKLSRASLVYGVSSTVDWRKLGDIRSVHCPRAVQCVSITESSAASQCNVTESSGLHTMTRRQQPAHFTAPRATASHMTSALSPHTGPA